MEADGVNVALRSEHAGYGNLDILSLCTGGGGLDLGIELAVPGARSVCMVEREAFAVAHLVSAMEAGLIHPAPVWSDARTFDGRAWRGCVDGLIGGIPCQPHSLAGRKGGSLDERDLWSTARRILVQSRAWFVLIENVGGMLSPGDDEIAGAERVWRDLRKLGFKVEGGLFTAAEVGASHERERLFILAVHDELADASVLGGGRGFREDGEILDGNGFASGGGAMADASGKRGAVGVSGSFRRGQEGIASQPVDGGDALVDAYGSRRPQAGRGYPFDAGQQSEQGSRALDDASISRGGRISVQPWRQDETCTDTDGTGQSLGDTIRGRHHGRANGALGRPLERAAAEGAGEQSRLFPPGPADLDRWRAILAHAPHLEPAVRRMVDGVAARLDLAGPHAARVERLRMLGNGVVSLEGAHAFRTLGSRLAGRGSAGAARLVRMMGAAE